MPARQSIHKGKTLETLQFDNIYSELPEIFYSRHPVEKLKNQFVIHFNPVVAELLDIDLEEFFREDLTDMITGRKPWSGIDPLGMCYAGHQFGQYVPRLGDGRALLLGQLRNADNSLWDLHLKGSGRTLYSRQGDGKAVLRSTIREYLCSAALAGLGIPTTQALVMFGSEEAVYRETIETGAMLIRVAPSHVRFGTFEFYFYQNRFEDLRVLADFVLQHYYAHLMGEKEPILAFFSQVIEDTANLIAQWQGVGFCHGVMNSDNMSIHGMTIDYGPFGFMDTFDSNHICNHSDHSGRYAFNRQPSIALFNLSCLAQAILPLLADDPHKAVEKATAALKKYEPLFDKAYLDIKRQKLGLARQLPGDQQLYDDLLSIMEKEKMDFTQTFRSLTGLDDLIASDKIRSKFKDWLVRYENRLQNEILPEQKRIAAMNKTNPKYVLRNYLAETAIQKARDEKDYAEIDRLMKLLQNPFQAQPEFDHYAQSPPDWAKSLSVSCSS